MQNISNNFVSAAKTESIERMNEFVSQMSPVVHGFFDRLAVCDKEKQ